MQTGKVLEWLQRTGFPLEMHAASAFRSAGFDVRQSATYSDPESSKGREIDVLAQDPDWIGVVEISFVVECKASPNPWVVLTSEDALSNYNRLFAFAITSLAARQALIGKGYTTFGALDPYIKRPSHGGYALRQAFCKDNDPAYAAAIGVMKACTDLAQDRTSSEIPRLAFVFPVIVVDSPLFECVLTEDGELKLTEVRQSEFLFSAYVPEHVGTCIKVITKSEVPEFARWAKKLADSIRQELKHEEARIFPGKAEAQIDA